MTKVTVIFLGLASNTALQDDRTNLECAKCTNFQVSTESRHLSHKSSKITLFFQDIERHQQTMKQYVHKYITAGIKKWRMKAHPIEHDFVTSNSGPFTEHLMFGVYF